MRTAETEERYERYRHFALKKIQVLRAYYRTGRMTDQDKMALNEALNSFIASARSFPSPS